MKVGLSPTWEFVFEGAQQRCEAIRRCWVSQMGSTPTYVQLERHELNCHQLKPRDDTVLVMRRSSDDCQPLIYCAQYQRLRFC